MDSQRIARELLRIEQSAEESDPLTDTRPDISVAAAYEMQTEQLRLRRARGERITGVKVGLTSRAKQERMGIDSPVTGWLTDAMALPEETQVDLDRLIHPRAEPEIVFVLGRRLAGPGMTADKALASVRAVGAGIEIIDSRYRDFRFRVPDVVADNASAARYITGATRIPPDAIDLAAEHCSLEVDGTVVDSATGSAVLGDPAWALARAANALGERGGYLEPGWLVLSGGMTDAVPLRPGRRITARFTSLGTVEAHA